MANGTDVLVANGTDVLVANAAFGDEESARAIKAHVAATVPKRRTAPKGRTGRPEEAAAVATFLATEQSSYVVGANFSVDGGENQT